MDRCKDKGAPACNSVLQKIQLIREQEENKRGIIKTERGEIMTTNMLLSGGLRKEM